MQEGENNTAKHDPPISPQQVGRPDDGQVLAMHVGDAAEGGQAGKMPHQKLQGPKITGAFIQVELQMLRHQQ